MKLIVLASFLIGVVAFVRFKFGRFVWWQPNEFLKGYELRGDDPTGHGHYGARRSGGRRHKGLDLKATPRTSFNAPFDCVIIRKGYVYGGDTRYRLAEIKGVGQFKDLTAKVMYLTDFDVTDKVIRRGRALGTVQDLSARHGTKMINHVHFELYRSGVLINPELYL